MRNVSRRAGFTLVELLVVIGIIALLISILLPALGKARESANSASCASSLHQMGILFAIYANNNKGSFPPASMTAGAGNVWSNPGNNPGGADPSVNGYSQSAPMSFWPDILTFVASKRTIQDAAGATTGSGSGLYSQYSNLANCYMMAGDFLPIFHDKDGPDLPITPRTSMYISNIRVIAPMNCRDREYGSAGSPTGSAPFYFLNLRKIGSFRDPSSTMMTWCAPVDISTGAVRSMQYDSSSWNLDDYGYGGGHCYLFPSSPAWSNFTAYSNRIGLGNDSSKGCSFGSPVTKTGLMASNVDYLSGQVIGMRFRHMYNTSMNALFIDGHCESRLLGAVKARDICTNMY